ncbi:MAG: HlyD family efflux transporter periplasmic adaptor subunit [Abditibacteriales bacterium]|nr:HlyD family efflux transporter periplasmic adaptor subunit [Abditibacteriales bacterium]MDW8366009.1 HlyD family efflux transporter periplasmic adaptor subunit [Abditibacteriales bacterium]
MNRLPTIIALVVSVVALTVAVVWMTRSPAPSRRSPLMSVGTMGGTSPPNVPAPVPSSGLSAAPTPMAAGGSPGFSGPGGSGGLMSAMPGGMMGDPLLRPRMIYTGTLQPAETMTVTAPLTGNIAEVYIKDGDMVQAGQKLIRLEATEPPRREVVIKAPRPGLVTASREMGPLSDPAMDSFFRFPHVGRHVSVGTALLDIVSEQSAIVLLNVPERDVSSIKLSQLALIRSRVLPDGTALKGKVVRISRLGHRGNFNTVMFPVTVKVSDALGKMRLGMSVEVELVGERADEATVQRAVPGMSGMTGAPPYGGMPSLSGS